MNKERKQIVTIFSNSEQDAQRVLLTIYAAKSGNEILGKDEDSIQILDFDIAAQPPFVTIETETMVLKGLMLTFVADFRHQLLHVPTKTIM